MPANAVTSHPYVYSIPMRVRFRGITVRDGVLLRGTAGWGEFSPFWGYDAAESAAWLRAAREAADVGWPAGLRTQIPVNVTVPAVDAAAAHRIVLASGGCRTAKVKVADPGQTLADDVARVRMVRRVLGPEGRIRVDANGLWNVDEAEHAIHALNEFDLEYVEQPCATIEELAEIRRRTGYLDVGVAADESVRRAEDPLLVARTGSADILVIKRLRSAESTPPWR